MLVPARIIRPGLRAVAPVVAALALAALCASPALASAGAAPAQVSAGAHTQSAPEARYGPVDGWFPYAVSLTRSATVRRSGPPDGWFTYAMSLTRTNTIASAAPNAISVPRGGFNWRDFGVGFAAAASTLLLLAGLRVSVRHVRHKLSSA